MDQTNTGCALPRTPETAELHSWDSTVLDIAKCDRTEFVVALLAEYETAGVRWETWPAAVQAIFDRHVGEWLQSHAHRTVRAVSYGAPKRDNKQVCVIILHHSPAPNK